MVLPLLTILIFISCMMINNFTSIKSLLHFISANDFIIFHLIQIRLENNVRLENDGDGHKIAQTIAR